MSPITHGFFNSNNPLADSNHRRASTIIDVGGNGDCGFRAIAAGLIDDFLQHPRIKTGAGLNKVLAKHFEYFPSHKGDSKALVTPTNRMEELLHNLRMPELIQALAYTLRQIAVTELCAHPELYRGAFIDDHNEIGMTPEVMRKPETWINESSIAALSNALDLPIKVRVIDGGKILPMDLSYNVSDNVQQPVVIQLENGHYKPEVILTERFKSERHSQPLCAVEPVVTEVQDPLLPEIIAAINAEDRRIADEFDRIKNRLSVMVDAGELNKDILLSIYVSNMKSSDYLKGRVAYVGVEHGNQHFFDAIVKAKGDSSSSNIPTVGFDKQIVGELVHALARAITIGQMNANEVFAQIDDRQEFHSALR